MTQPAGIVMIGGLSLDPVSTSVKMNMMKLKRRFDGHYLSLRQGAP
jgi:hypothetical protein